MPEQEGLNSGEHPYSSYRDLMRRRITEILLVSSQYDSFIMEEDGGLVEQISSKYLDLHLSRSPRLKRVSSSAEAFEALGRRRYDLVVTMKQLGDMDAFTFGREVKRKYPGMPVVLLLHRMSDTVSSQTRMQGEGVDRVFMWSGESGIFLAMIKSLEDGMNVDEDVATANVRVIILVEDSPLHYSSFLPMLLGEVMRHCQAILPEDINTMHRLYRMRARPKILLARTYEEARALVEKYRENLLTVISDIQLPRGGEMCANAGTRLYEEVCGAGVDVPYLFLSAQENFRPCVEEMGAKFISKHSPSLAYELRDFIADRLGFGDFVFRMPGGQEVARASDVTEFEKLLAEIPDEALLGHLEGRHFSNWFMARGEFSLAEVVGQEGARARDDLARARKVLLEAIARNAVDRRKGRISDFSPEGLGQASFLMRLGRGSVGGKARGLAFMAMMMSAENLSKEFEGVLARIPRTVAISVDEFERFIEDNGLRRFAFETYPDEEIAEAFLDGRLPDEMLEGLASMLRQVRYPLAIRSSSLLEDSHNVPFAGIYSTYMLANSHPDAEVRREQLHRAVKLVYASVFFGSARRYLESVNVRIAEEKMGIIIQEMIGRRHGGRYYPDISGVAHSYNFYPTGRLKPEDGVAHVALGLGRIVTDDGEALRFSPAHPRVLPQFNTVGDYLKLTQKQFYALDMSDPAALPVIDDGADLVRCDLATAEKDGALAHVGAVYVRDDDAIYDGIMGEGPRLVTFGNVLKHKSFPLAAMLKCFLEMGTAGMGCPVELEFAVTLPAPGEEGQPVFNLLQIRPMFASGEDAAVDLEGIDEDRVLCRSTNTLSNGEIKGIRDVVYVRPADFDELKTPQMAAEFGRINERLFAEKRPYIAIGLGRWGTSEASLGIPVEWTQICGARALVETGRPGYVIDPSHGTHFFQNLTSLRVAYLNVHPERDPMDWEWLEAQQIVEDLEYVRHVRTSDGLTVMVDGRLREGAILRE
jgi:CheY-like chemotaxis protein